MTTTLRGRAGVEQRKRRMMRSNYLCEWCRDKGVTRTAEVVDHIVPLAKGGSDEDANTRNLCSDHHKEATAAQFGFKPPRKQIGVDGWPV